MEKHPSYQTGDINKEGRVMHEWPAGSYRAKVPNLSGWWRGHREDPQEEDESLW